MSNVASEAANDGELTTAAVDLVIDGVVRNEMCVTCNRMMFVRGQTTTKSVSAICCIDVGCAGFSIRR